MHEHMVDIDLMHIIIHGLIEAIKISLIVFIMMVIVDFINVKFKGKLSSYFTKKKWKQFLLSGLLGILPGCGGTFAVITLYVHGTVTIGALTATMVATSGDEAFYMLSVIPKTAFVLFGILFVLGIISGVFTDFILKHLKFKAHVDCKVQQFHPYNEGWKHYVKDHIYHHIFKKHIIKIFIWTLVAIWVIHILNHFLDLEHFVKSYPVILILIAALVGLIPESGPHIFFISLFAAGTIPFSVLLANSVSQDGHGVLPLMSMCIKDTVIIKVLNVVYAFIFGLIFYSLGF